MGAGSAVLSKKLRNMQVDKDIGLSEFKVFMGSHYKESYVNLFHDLALHSDSSNSEHITHKQLKIALEDRFVFEKLWRQFRKTWDGGPDWNLVKTLIKSRPSAVTVLGEETRKVSSNDLSTLLKEVKNQELITVKSDSDNTTSKKGNKRGNTQQKMHEVIFKRTLLDLAIEHAVTREYRLDLQTLTMMHEAWPELILQRNVNGDNPLHVAVATWPRSPTDVVVSLVELSPQAARERDGKKRLPLAAALEKGTADELVLALAMADADHVFTDEVQKVDALHGSRLDHILRSGQVEARREIKCSILNALQYPKAAWIRLGDEFNIRSLVATKGAKFRKEAEEQTQGATKGVFIPPVHKATTIKTYLKHAELALVGSQQCGIFSKRYIHDFLAPLMSTTRTFLEDEIKWAHGHPALLKQVFDVLRLRLYKLAWRTKELASTRDNYRAYHNRPGFEEVIKKAKLLQDKCNETHQSEFIEQGVSDIPSLYAHAFKCHDKLAKLIQNMSEKTEGYSYMAPLKSIYRVLERTAFVENDDERWDASKVCDVVRGIIEYSGEGGLEHMVDGLEFLTQSSLVEIVSLKENFQHPTEGAWFDMRIYVTFIDDPNRHICEIQLLERYIKGIRKSLGNMQDVEEFKAAKELLITTGSRDLVETPAPKQKASAEESPEHRLLLETVDALMMEVRNKTKLLMASKSVVAEKERLIAVRDEEIAKMQREITKLKRRNEILSGKDKGDKLAANTAMRAASIKLDRGNANTSQQSPINVDNETLDASGVATARPSVPTSKN